MTWEGAVELGRGLRVLSRRDEMRCTANHTPNAPHPPSQHHTAKQSKAPHRKHKHSLRKAGKGRGSLRHAKGTRNRASGSF